MVNHHVIETDLEPDDVVTLIAHARKHHVEKTPVQLTLVVGEGDARMKVLIARRILALIVDTFPGAYVGWIRILQGDSSPTPYPTEHLPKEWLVEDGSVDNLDYATLYSDPNITTVFMLKPPREALRLHRRLNLRNIQAHAYGGFNWRATGADVAELRSLSQSYGNFFYYFRFTAIGESSLYQIKVPMTTPLLDALSRIIFNWNTHMVQKARNRSLGVLYNARTSVEEQARDIISTIEGKEMVQFVMADVLTILSDLPIRPVQFGGPTWISDDSSTVFVHDDNPETMVKRRDTVVQQLDWLFERVAKKPIKSASQVKAILEANEKKIQEEKQRSTKQHRDFFHTVFQEALDEHLESNPVYMFSKITFLPNLLVPISFSRASPEIFWGTIAKEVLAPLGYNVVRTTQLPDKKIEVVISFAPT